MTCPQLGKADAPPPPPCRGGAFRGGRARQAHRQVWEPSPGARRLAAPRAEPPGSLARAQSLRSTRALAHMMHQRAPYAVVEPGYRRMAGVVSETDGTQPLQRSRPADDPRQHASERRSLSHLCHHEAIISGAPWSDACPCRRSGRAWCARAAGSSAPTPGRTGRSSRRARA
jgi:hypothetical protein